MLSHTVNEKVQVEVEIAEMSLPGVGELLRWGQGQGGGSSVAKMDRQTSISAPCGSILPAGFGHCRQKSLQYGPRWSFQQQRNMLASLF